MSSFVADPHWGWWIVFYFYLGGIAAGAYFMATLIDLVGADSDRPLARTGYYLAAPLVAICGVLLILDLNYPARFWHMLLGAESGLAQGKEHATQEKRRAGQIDKSIAWSYLLC